MVALAADFCVRAGCSLSGRGEGVVCIEGGGGVRFTLGGPLAVVFAFAGGVFGAVDGGLALASAAWMDLGRLAAQDAEAGGAQLRPLAPRAARKRLRAIRVGGIGGGTVALDGAVGRAVDLAALAQVGEAQVGDFSFPLAVGVDEGGLAAVDAEVLCAPLFGMLARQSGELGGRREVGDGQAGGALGAVGRGIHEAGGSRPLAHIFADLDEVREAVGEELAVAWAALVARGGLAAHDAEALAAPGLPFLFLIFPMVVAAAGHAALFRAVFIADSGCAALGADAFGLPTVALSQGALRGRAGEGGSRGGGGFGQIGGVSAQLGGLAGRALDRESLGHVFCAHVGGLSLPLAVQMDEGGLAAFDAEAVLAALDSTRGLLVHVVDGAIMPQGRKKSRAFRPPFRCVQRLAVVAAVEDARVEPGGGFGRARCPGGGLVGRRRAGDSAPYRGGG